ncbi:MAG: chemotaxis protein CheW [Thermodesulfobacteriota bacterium]
MADHFAAGKLETEQEMLMQLVGFKIGNELFGVDILLVQEIIRSAPITEVPNSPDFVEGVINLRGHILPVIDLRKRLKLTRKSSDLQDKTWILILDIHGKITGFIVDSVTKVLKIQEDTIEPPPDVIMAGLESQYLRGVCDVDGQLLILLDFKQILLQEELQKLKAIDTGE